MPRSCARALPRAFAVLLAGLPVACSSVVPASASSAPPPSIAWVKGAAEAANGPALDIDLVVTCGSDTALYLAELADTSPLAARVMKEWGDTVEGGKSIMASGAVASAGRVAGSLPMNHVFGDDLGMVVDLDPPFAPLARRLGADAGELADGQVRAGLSSGLVPHLPRAPGPPTGELYRASADRALDHAGFQPGFDEPQPGDRVLAMGRFVVDCRHADHGTEIHTTTFLAWTHTEGSRATTRMFYNPYRDTELFALDATKLGLVDDQARLGTVRPFPRVLVQQVIGLDTGAVDRLRSLELVDAARAAPADFVVCAPGPKEKTLEVRHDVVVRRGAEVTITPDATTGCARVHAAPGAYRPVDVAIRSCSLPWKSVNEILAASVGKPIDLRKLIGDNLSTDAGKARLALDPEAACADALSGPPVTATPAGQSVRVDDAQPFPFYGVITAEWTNR